MLILLLVTATLASSQVRISRTVNPNLGHSDGEIIVEARGSAAPFVIQLLDGSGEVIRVSDPTFVSGTFTFDNLSDGTYSILIIDKTNCEHPLGPLMLVEEDRCELVVVIDDFMHNSVQTYGSCPAEGVEEGISQDAYISPRVLGADNPSFNWTGPEGFTATTPTISDLLPGRYQLTVTDGVCSAAAELIIVTCEIQYGCSGVSSRRNPPINGIAFSEVISPTGAQANGRIAVSPRVVTLLDFNSEYYWTDDRGNYYSGSTIDNLEPGEYCFHAVYGCGGQIEECIELHDCDVDPIGIRSLNSCTDPNYAEFTIVLTGGRNAEILDTIDFNNNRTIIAEDDRGCRVEQTFVLANIGPFMASIDIIRPSTILGDGVISVTLNGELEYAPYYLYVDGERFELPNNQGSNEITLVGVESGTHSVTIRNGIGCALRLEDIEIPGCDGVEPMIVRSSYIYEEADPVFSPRLGRMCNNDAQLHVDILDGIDPYTVRVEAIDPTINWSFQTVLGVDETSVTIEEILPDVPVRLSVTDGCDNTYSEEVRYCDHCEFDYNNHDEGFSFGTSRAVTIDIDNACGGRSGLFGLGMGTDIEVRYFEPIEEWELPYTITWPDGRGTFEIYWENGKVLSRGIDKIDLDTENDDDLGDFTVLVERGDGCQLTLPFVVNHEETHNYSFVFVDGPGFGIPQFQDLVMGTEQCRECNPAPSIPGSADCTSSTRWFEYQPNNPNDPCGSGGTLTWYWEGASSFSFEEISTTVRPSDIIGSVSSAGLGVLVDPLCVTGGGCIIRDILGNGDLPGTGGIPLLVPVCSAVSTTSSGDCDGGCPSGHECSLGECRPICEVNFCADLCDFAYEEGSGDRTIYFDNNLAVGSTIRLVYNTGDEFANSFNVTGGAIGQIGEVVTGAGVFNTIDLQIASNEPIRIDVRAFGGGALDRWAIEIECNPIN